MFGTTTKDIGDIVKSQTGTLVIVATKSVLSRPWCAVEITSGVNNKIDIVMVPRQLSQ